MRCATTALLPCLLVAPACFTYDRQSNDDDPAKPTTYVEACMARDEPCETCRRDRCSFGCCEDHACVVALSKTTNCLFHFPHWDSTAGACWEFVGKYSEPLLTCMIAECEDACFPGPDPWDQAPTMPF